MTLPVKHSGVQLPAAFAPFVGHKANNELTQGVQSGFPIISFRGKVWRVRKSGTEENYVNEEGEAMPSIELVLIRSNPQPSKTFYDTAYEEGSAEPPRCWSSDGLKPDAEVVDPISKNCAMCPNNRWGSKTTDTGKKSRACADVRRIAVVFAHELDTKGADATLLLLRVPPASLNPLKDYAEKTLEPRGLQYFMLVTKIGFDPNVAHPKMTFKPKRMLSEEEAEAVVALRESEDARRILAEATEFEVAGTTGGDEASVQSSVAAEEGTTAPAASSPSRKPKTRPADEEDFEDAPAPAPKPKKKAASPPPAEEDEDEEELPPAPAKPKKKAAPPPPAEDDEEDEDEDEVPAPKPKKAPKPTAPAAEEEEEDFDSMLDSILSPTKTK